MRVLSCSAVVFIALAMLACYSPALEDCQFKCGTGSSVCPDGTSCMGGFCRNSTTGTCGSGSGTGIDAAIDGPPACPATPCPPAVPIPVTGGCGVLCTSFVTYTGAGQTCSGSLATGWHLAVLASVAKRSEYKQKFSAANGWVGLTFGTSWTWLDGTSQPLGNPPWASGEPIVGRNDGKVDTTGTPVLKTGSASDTAPFFCEHAP